MQTTRKTRPRKSQYEGFRDSLGGFFEDVRSDIDEDTQGNSQESTQQNRQEGRRTPKRTLNRTGEQSRGHSTEQESTQEDTQQSGQSTEQARGHSTEHPGEHPSEQATEQALPNLQNKNIKDPIIWLQDNYAIVLKHLIKTESRITKLSDIKEKTKIPYGTVRKALKCLEDTGFITHPQSYHKGRVRGFTYNIDENLCRRFLEEREEHSREHSTGQAREHSREQPIEHSTERALKRTLNGTPCLYSSSSSLNINTTTAEIERILVENPELGYWRQKGISPKQVEEWMKTAECNLESMIQYMCYCRFEMVDMGIEESRPIENVLNWFFRIIEKTGGYPKPKDYKSHREKQIEQEKALIAQQEKEIQTLRDLWRQKHEKQRELEFWQMMGDPEGDLYKQCFDRLNNFAKKKAEKGGPAFEACMRTAFNEVMDALDAGDGQPESNQLADEGN